MCLPLYVQWYSMVQNEDFERKKRYFFKEYDKKQLIGDLPI